MTEAAFLAALAEEPRDDATRLVYADWLEERGDARAELLRLQVGLKSLPLGTPENALAQARLREVRKECEPEWLQAVEPLAQLGLSIRATNCLESEGITTVTALHDIKPEEILEIRGFGETTLKEVQRKLSAWGMNLD